ncbi:MAG: methyltransferase domain-containing protein, partial [Deltaproteobacteria bacterium]|nr:methyltransferase domain-containing protein [Deltaproteobacteria bacterium]
RHPRVEYRCVTAEASGLADASVDLVVAAQAAHWFDWPRFCDEATRIGRPGALIALVSYGIPTLAGEPGRELAHYYHDVAGPYWLPERALVVSGYRELVMPWPEIDAPAIEMTVIWTRDELVGYASTWSATSRLVAQHGPSAFDAFARRLAATWPDAEPRIVSWPLGIRLARR